MEEKNHLTYLFYKTYQVIIIRRLYFQSDIHFNLKEITLSFNQLGVIKSFTFTDLPELTYLNLEENSVRIVETKAFNNLNKLRWLHLRGNRLETIEPLAFSNLPELQFLDLTFNNLNKFDLTVLDEVSHSPYLLWRHIIPLL